MDRRGEQNSNSTLTEAQVIEILSERLNSPGVNVSALARELGIDRSLIYRIRSGERWPHLTSKSSEYVQKGVKLTLEQAQQIYDDVKVAIAPISQSQAAKKYKVSRSVVIRIISGLAWKDVKRI